MASEVDKKNLIKNTFRRSSLTKPGDGRLVIEADMMPDILGQMGQAYDKDKLQAFIDKIDSNKTGYLDQIQYEAICKEFVKNPAAVGQMGGNEFLFKNLILPEDFPCP